MDILKEKTKETLFKKATEYCNMYNSICCTIDSLNKENDKKEILDVLNIFKTGVEKNILNLKEYID